MSQMYNPSNWFWSVGGDTTRYWSSAQAAFVNAGDALFVEFIAQGGQPTPIDSMQSLLGVLAEQYPAGSLQTYLAARRYLFETGGIVVAGAKVDTSRESQSMIANAYAYVQASGAASVTYKAVSGWVTLSADEIKALALAVGAHVQDAFMREALCLAEMNATPPTITTRAQVDEVFV